MRKKFLEFANSHDFTVVDGERSIKKVHEELTKKVKKVIKKTNGRPAVQNVH